MGFPGGASGKEPTCQCRRQKRQGFDSWVGKMPWRRAWQPTPVFLPGESMDRGAWQAAFHRVAKGWTRLKWLSIQANFHYCKVALKFWDPPEISQLSSVQSLSRVQLFATPWTVACQAPLSMDSPGKNTGVGSHFLSQGIFLTQGSKPGLQHCGSRNLHERIK